VPDQHEHFCIWMGLQDFTQLLDIEAVGQALILLQVFLQL
jgi:hypothetical protein